MAGLVDVGLRGLLLVLTSLVLGGVVWARLALRVGPRTKPDAAARLALHVTAGAAGLAAVAQIALAAVALAAVGSGPGGWPSWPALETTFAQAAVARAALAGAVGAGALVLARRPARRAAWAALTVGAVALVASSATISHAMARMDGRAVLLALDAAHQVAVAVWVGGLAHLTLWAAQARRGAGAHAPVVRRFSRVAFAAVSALALAGVPLAWLYVGDLGGLLGTAYGVMIGTKALLLVAILTLAGVNFRAVRRTVDAPGIRLFRLVEVELGLAVTVLLAAASLTSLPPATDVTSGRASLAEVGQRFVPAAPRLTSPPIAALLAEADPLMAEQTTRAMVERQWSESNHHWAGVVVLLMGLLAFAERGGVRAARHWPLAFLGLGGLMFVRGDPRAWPLGPAGFWESMRLPDVLQHRTFVLIVVGFGVFEWAVRTGRLPRRPWAFVFPALCAAGSAVLLTHSHAMFDLKEEFLVEVTHVPIGILGSFIGWARWLELRLPQAGPGPGWVWRSGLVVVGALLLFYREP
jgi:putative copper resistance protein D